MNINRRRSYTEMLEILNHLEFFEAKIPSSLIEKMKLEKDNDWIFKYDDTVALQNQNMLYSTKALYLYLYTKYIATAEKRKELEGIYEDNARKKYNPDNLFKRKNIQLSESEEHNIDITSKNNITVIEEKWYKKIFNIIKNIFKKS